VIDLEDRLRALRTLDVGDGATVPALRRRANRRRMRRVAAVGAALTLGVSAVFVVWSDDEGRVAVDTADDASTSTVAPTTTSPSGGYVPSTSVMVTAGPEGVHRFEDGKGTAISAAPAAVAYLPGDGSVVFQDGSMELNEFPLTPEGPARVWENGEVRDLPADPEARSVRLLDAGLVDGSPTALVAEVSGDGAGPDDTFESLVRIDLVDDSRQVLMRRASWESSHRGARLLPDGDVIGLVHSEALVLLMRWTAGSDDPLWTTEVGFDTRMDLTLRGEEVALVHTAYDASQWDMTVTTHDPETGGAVSTATVTIQDAAGEIATGLVCTGWGSDTEVICGRSDGTPVAVAVDTGEFGALPGGEGDLPGAASRTGTPGTTTSPTVDPDGATAVWLLDPGGLPAADSDTFTAMVSRLGCAGGETGEVFDPSIETNDYEVVVTFTVAALPREGVYTCPSNIPVPYVVNLGEPLGARTIVDGACRDGEAASTSFCDGEVANGGQRWPRPGQ